MTLGRTRERATELDRLVALAAEAESGRSTSVVLRGPAGVGKSWLLDQLCGRVAATARVLRCSGHPAETDLPFAGLHQLLSPVLRHIDALPDPQRHALAAALALRPASPGERFAVAAGLHALLAEIAETEAIVIVVDDVQWLDASTVEALTFAARRLDADRVAMVLAVRSDEDSQLGHSGFDVADVPPLDRRAALELLRAAYPDMSSHVAEEVLAVAGGLPLVLLEAPAELTAAQRRGDAALGRALSPGATLERLYRSRLAGLGENVRLALAVAALGEFDIGLLDSMLASLGLSLDDLEPAESAGLIRTSAGGVVFGHPAVTSAVKGSTSESAWRRCHRAIAAALAHEPVRQAWYLEALTTGVDDEVADALRVTAGEAEGRGAYAEAGRAHEAAAARSSRRADAHASRAAAARCHAIRGAHGPLSRVLGELVATADDPAERIHWHNALLSAQIWTSPSPPDAEWVRALAEESAGHSPVGAARLLTTMAQALLIAGLHLDAADLSKQARAIAGPAGRDDLAMALTWDAVDLVIGASGAGTVLLSDWASTVRDDELRDPDLPIVLAATALSWMDAPDRAITILRRQERVLRDSGALGQLGVCVALLAGASQRRGDWVTARAQFGTSIQLCTDTDLAGAIPHIGLRRAYLLAAIGADRECRDIVTAARGQAGALPNVDHLSYCVLGRLDLGAGHVESAVEHLQAAGRLERSMGLVEPGYTGRVGDLLEALWRLRRVEEGREELEVFQAHAERTGRVSAQAIVARCRGLFAADGGFDPFFARAVDLHGHFSDPYEQARTELLWGLRLRRTRRKREARQHLHAALDAFQHLGAQPWIDVTRAELAACGERRGALPGPAAELTPRELEIAVTVARGASNPEAAAALCISARTVEYHLTNVYRKLGITERVELAAALGS